MENGPVRVLIKTMFGRMILIVANSQPQNHKMLICGRNPTGKGLNLHITVHICGEGQSRGATPMFCFVWLLVSVCNLNEIIVSRYRLIYMIERLVVHKQATGDCQID